MKLTICFVFICMCSVQISSPAQGIAATSTFAVGDRVDLHINLDANNSRYFKSNDVDNLINIRSRLAGSSDINDHYMSDLPVSDYRSQEDQHATITKHDIQQVIKANQDKQQVVNTDAPPVVVGSNGLEKTGGFKDPMLGKFFSDSTSKLSTAIHSVGRIEIDGVALGTGFVVGEDQIMTNCHVMSDFIRRSSDGTKYEIVGTDVLIDFGVGTQHDAASEFQIIAVDFVPAMEGLDAIVLHVSDKSKQGANPLPPILKRGTYSGTKQMIALIGYPDLIDKDPRATRLTNTVYQTIARNNAAKIVTLGYITDSHNRNQYTVLDHTSSTAGGIPDLQLLMSTEML